MEATEEAYFQLAREVHDSRCAATERLQTEMRGLLDRLEMKKARLEVQIEYSPDRTTALGCDTVEFLLSANPGEEPKPLSRVASGGELSRVLLALKAALADAYPVPTYLFDEIDSGVGGRTALSVGRLLADLGRRYQVLCITHTPQLAAFANNHYVVEKEEKGGKTFVRLRELSSRKQRVEEIARMLSGLEDSSTGLSHAEELLDKFGPGD